MSRTLALPLEPGAEIAGFRLERVIGRGSQGVVYEATQLSLDRSVAVKVIPPDPDLAERSRRLQWPDHPHAVSMYAAGVCEHGQYVAMRLVRGTTLAALQLEPAETLNMLRGVADALDAAHAAGIVHGAVRTRNVLVDRDGRALLSDFGLGPPDATLESDRTAFTGLVRECLGDDLPDLENSSSAAIVSSAARALPPMPVAGRRQSPRRWPVAAALALIGVAAALAFLLAGGSDEPEPAPPILTGTQALGSELAPGGMRTVDCRGRPPSGASQACTVSQSRLPGRTVVARRDGVIRRWAVRGARGEVALQVFRRRGDEFVEVARSDYERIPDVGVHVVPVTLPVRAGDRVGLEVTPGAAVGVRPGARAATTVRWFGPLTFRVRPVESGEGSGFDHELLLRVEYVPGAVSRSPGTLTGRAARLAPSGRELDAREVELRDGVVRKASVVKLRARIAIDLFAGQRRLERLVVGGADPRGTLLNLGAYGRPIVSVQWRNPDGRTFSRGYVVNARSLLPRN